MMWTNFCLAQVLNFRVNRAAEAHCGPPNPCTLPWVFSFINTLTKLWVWYQNWYRKQSNDTQYTNPTNDRYPSQASNWCKPWYFFCDPNIPHHESIQLIFHIIPGDPRLPRLYFPNLKNSSPSKGRANRSSQAALLFLQLGNCLLVLFVCLFVVSWQLLISFPN